MAAALPGAFGADGVLFAISYVALQVGRNVAAASLLGPRPAAARRVRAPRRLERGVRRALARGRGAARRSAAAAVDPCRRARPLRPGGRLLAAAPRPRGDHRLRHRGRPLHRPLPGLHHHRAGRVDRGHRRDRRRRRPVLDGRPLPRRRVPRDRRVVVAVLRRGRRALAPGHELVRGPGPARPRRLHLPARPDRGGDHRRRGRRRPADRRAGARAARRRAGDGARRPGRSTSWERACSGCG